MAGPRYTEEQLRHLQFSPLVKKPDGLPSISQWMWNEVPAEQNNPNNNAGGVTNRRARPLRASDAATEALNNPMGQFARRQSMRKFGPEPVPAVVAAINALFVEPGEETVLGPPKFNFASATRATKNKDTSTAITSTDGEHPGDRFPKADRSERWRERDGERTREKPYPNGRRAGREDGDSWAASNAKARKSLGQEDFDRGFGRNSDRDADNGEATTRRGANTRWARRDETVKDGEGNRFATGGEGGWRDRARNKEREKDREWTRGGGKEEDPEWMDAPVEKKETKHTQEEFQRWLEQNRAKGNKIPVEVHDEPPPEVGHIEEAPIAAVVQPPLKMAPGMELNLGGMFGTWGKEPLAEPPIDAIPTKAKPDKKSRFMNMFAKPEEPAMPAPPPPEDPISPATETNADREGFNRILQMLGGANLNGPQSSSPGIAPPTNGNRQGAIPLDFPHYSSPPVPELPKSRAPSHQVPSTRDQQALLENILAQQRPTGLESRPLQQARFNNMSPDNALQDRYGVPRADTRFSGEEYSMQQPPRNQNIQDPNLAAILNSRREDDNNRERQSKEFLLNLMQQPRNTPPQMLTHNLPRQPQDGQSMAFYDQPGQRPQGQPKGRGGPPPGFMDDRMFENEMLMRREAERQLQIRELQQQEAMRNKSRGLPMGFPGHDDALLGLQRRNTAGEIPRQMTNMGIPSQPVPDMPAMYGGRQPGMPPTPQDRPNIAPPPGFGMRQPPGLGGPGPQQQMGPGPSFSAGNTPLGHPPGFPPPNNMPRGFGGPGGPGNGMPGPPPQGYFPPPGYGPPPPMGMRGVEDPRMMFEQQQFGGPVPRQQGRPGPPNMY
ncbi:hypothetical protein P280DRAFT_442120 [Massarina eburnea CBS 473.64]|uniref:Uncharacterized protein n=1 Tax=Massarina eburnea CBS 473.64 TaxID=1395130 RepID=A0A6A6SCF9_9PLEO|nr:hypothetical protein P280DRAFT_442120 [Massarina eburnea CBS 473.64]